MKKLFAILLLGSIHSSFAQQSIELKGGANAIGGGGFFGGRLTFDFHEKSFIRLEVNKIFGSELNQELSYDFEINLFHTWIKDWLVNATFSQEEEAISGRDMAKFGPVVTRYFGAGGMVEIAPNYMTGIVERQFPIEGGVGETVFQDERVSSVCFEVRKLRISLGSISKPKATYKFDFDFNGEVTLPLGEQEYNLLDEDDVLQEQFLRTDDVLYAEGEARVTLSRQSVLKPRSAVPAIFVYVDACTGEGDFSNQNINGSALYPDQFANLSKRVTIGLGVIVGFNVPTAD